jgi:hypothetical protein
MHKKHSLHALNKKTTIINSRGAICIDNILYSYNTVRLLLESARSSILLSKYPNPKISNQKKCVPKNNYYRKAFDITFYFYRGVRRKIYKLIQYFY